MDVKMIAKPSEEDAGRALNKLAWAAVILASGVGVGIIIVALGWAFLFVCQSFIGRTAMCLRIWMVWKIRFTQWGTIELDAFRA